MARESSSGRSRLLVLLIVAAVAVPAIAARFVLAARDLPYYSIDENEIVEPALAFLCGTADPHWFGYGPLVSYVLAGLFSAWEAASGFARGWTRADFFYAAFFEPTPFYVIARLMHSAASLGCAVLMWSFAERSYGRAAGLAALVIGLAPVLERNAEFTARVDTFQGLLVLGSLWCARAYPAAGRRAGPYLGAGALTGLSLAVKPLQGLLPLPVVALAGWLAAGRGERRIARMVAHPATWAFWPALLAAFAIANPYAVLRPRALWEENARLVGVARPGSVAGHDYGWAPAALGWPLAIAVAAALVAALRWKDAPSRLLLAAVAVFCGALLVTPTRPYWYNAILPAALVLVARLAAEVGVRLSRPMRTDPTLAAGLAALVLAAVPLVATARLGLAAWREAPTVERRADRAAQRWIEAHVPPGARLLLVGHYSIDLPRLVASTREAHGRWGEIFMYGRGQNAGWVEAFRRAYREHRRRGAPSYDVVNVRRPYGNQDADAVRNRRMDTELAALARAEHAAYLVTASPQAFRGQWESGPGVRLLAVFGPSTGHAGHEVKVFAIETGAR